MENKQIKDLMVAMGRTGMSRLSIKNGGFELELERRPSAGEQQFVEVSPEAQGEPQPPRKNDIPAALHPPVNAMPGVKVDEGAGIDAPMVGTYYGSPSPDDPSFVKVGDNVDVDTVVCIIEAMKVMNEVKAGVKGTIAEVLVEDGHPVEFGTNLFRVS